jgi:hypothetical protein
VRDLISGWPTSQSDALGLDQLWVIFAARGSGEDEPRFAHRDVTIDGTVGNGLATDSREEE